MNESMTHKLQSVGKGLDDHKATNELLLQQLDMLMKHSAGTQEMSELALRLAGIALTELELEPVLRAIVHSHPDPERLKAAWAHEQKTLLRAQGLLSAEQPGAAAAAKCPEVDEWRRGFFERWNEVIRAGGTV